MGSRIAMNFCIKIQAALPGSKPARTCLVVNGSELGQLLWQINYGKNTGVPVCQFLLKKMLQMLLCQANNPGKHSLPWQMDQKCTI
jgi:hypothetical protein